MRWTIRKSHADLHKKGRLEYEERAGSDSVPSLIDALHTVERNSWKEESGTSITKQEHQERFHRSLADLAARSGYLSGHVLRLDGHPIAFILGIAAGDGAFLDLKGSFDASNFEHSLGHVLKRDAVETLIARGVHLYDFMGNCES